MRFSSVRAGRKKGDIFELQKATATPKKKKDHPNEDVLDCEQNVTLKNPSSKVG